MLVFYLDERLLQANKQLNVLCLPFAQVYLPSVHLYLPSVQMYLL